MKERLALVGFGAVTAVGLTAPQTCAAVRGGISGYTLSGYRDSVHGPKLHAEAPLRPPPAQATQFSRLVALAAAALNECLESAGIASEECAVFISVREPFRAGPGTNWRDAALLAAIQDVSGRRFGTMSEIVSQGNAGAFLALSRAKEHLASRRATACIVGGVDSLLNTCDRRRLGSAFRLKSEHVAQGLVPGEGAAFVALMEEARRPGAPVILGIGLASEDSDTSVLGDAEPMGIGLAEAIRQALLDARMSEAEIAFLVSDMNGETYGALDRMLAETRVFRTRRERFPQILPAVSVGEIGAAAGPLLIIIAATALQRGYALGRVAVCEASSEGGLRGACVLSADPLRGYES